MKNLLIIFAILMSWSYVEAQNTKVKSDSTKSGFSDNVSIGTNNPGDITGSIFHKNRYKYNKCTQTHCYSRWTGINLGFNQLLFSDGNLERINHSNWEINPWKSRTWDFDILGYSLPLIKPYLLLTSGVGFQFRNYSFEKNIDLVYMDDNVIPVIVTKPEFTKNKLHITYLHIPLLLEVNTSAKPKKGFYLAGGMILGIRMYSALTQKFKNGTQKIKLKTTDNFNLNNFQFTWTMRVGFNRFTIVGSYDIFPLFDNTGYNYEVYNFTFGLQLTGF